MKNPFVQMALLAAAMAAAFRENAMRDQGLPIPTGARYRHRGPRNPAGSKLIRKFYRNKHGRKADLDDSLQWYRAPRFDKKLEAR